MIVINRVSSLCTGVDFESRIFGWCRNGVSDEVVDLGGELRGVFVGFLNIKYGMDLMI